MYFKGHDNGDRVKGTHPLEIFIKSHRYGMAQHLHFVQKDSHEMLKVSHQSCSIYTNN